MKTKLLVSCLGLMCLLATAGLVHHFNKTEVRKPVTENKKEKEVAVLIKFKEGIISPVTLLHATNELKQGALGSIFES